LTPATAQEAPLLGLEGFALGDDLAVDHQGGGAHHSVCHDVFDIRHLFELRPDPQGLDRGSGIVRQGVALGATGSKNLNFFHGGIFLSLGFEDNCAIRRARPVSNQGKLAKLPNTRLKKIGLPLPGLRHQGNVNAGLLEDNRFDAGEEFLQAGHL
jgi:hypothetical protein